MSASLNYKIKNYRKRKYLNLMLENILSYILGLSVFILVYVLLESFFYFSSYFKSFILYFVLTLSSFWFFFFILKNLLLSFYVFSINSDAKLASEIGKLNEEIDDKLLNYFELSSLNNELSELAANQIDKHFSDINFIQYLNRKKIFLLLIFFSFPLFVFAGLSLISFDKFFKDSISRITHYDEDFVKPLGFEIDILNNNLNVIEGGSYLLKFKSNSTDQLYLFQDENIYLLQSIDSIYNFEFTDINSPVQFNIGTRYNKSYSYNLDLINAPKITSIKMIIDYPSYIGKRSDTLFNILPITVLNHTNISWKFTQENTTSVSMKVDSTYSYFINDNNDFIFTTKLNEACNYNILFSNPNLNNFINISSNIEVINDAYPKMEISYENFELEHSFNIFLEDDYQIRKFGFQLYSDDKIIESKRFNIYKSELTRRVEFSKFKYADKKNIKVRFYASDNDPYIKNKITFSKFYNLEFIDSLKYRQELSLKKDSILDQYLNNKLKEKFETDSDKNSKEDKDILKEEKEKLKQAINENEKLKLNIENSEINKELSDIIEKQKQQLSSLDSILKSSDPEQVNLDSLAKRNKFEETRNINSLRDLVKKELSKKILNDLSSLENKVSQKDYRANDSIINKIDKNIDFYKNLLNNNRQKETINKEFTELKNSVKTKQKNEKINKDIQSLKSLFSDSNSLSMDGPSINLHELNSYLNTYLNYSFDEEDIINSNDLLSESDQFELISNLRNTNNSFYNFTLENPDINKSSFDLIYNLNEVLSKFYYDDINEYNFNIYQGELLRDVNYIIDFLSDIISNIQSSSSNSSGEGKSEKMENLIQKQRELNDQINGEGNQISSEELNDILKKQDEIKNRFNELNQGINPEVNDSFKDLKKALLKNNRSEVLKQQSELIRRLKDFNGKAKEEDNKRESTIFYDTVNPNNLVDSLNNKKDNLERDLIKLDPFYENILNKTK